MVVALMLSGCATGPVQERAEPGAVGSTTASPVDIDGTASASPVLRIDGESLVLGDATGVRLPLGVFVAGIQRRLATGHDEVVGELVRAYPELAERAVLSADSPLRAQQAIAAWLDRLAAPLPGGWSSFVADRSGHPQRYARWERDRAEAWLDLRRGAFAEVAGRDLDLPIGGPSPWPALDATLLRATTTLAAGRPADAATRFEQAADRAMEWDRRVATRARLFASLAHDLSGNLAASQSMRQSAVQALSLPDIQDPMVLGLLLETQASGRTSTGGALAGPSARSIRARLGSIELQRGSPQAALLAWRAAETEPGNYPTREQLRINQVEALIALGQDEPAIAMLIGLARTDVRPEALVMLGLVQLRRGHVNVALPVLREAVDATHAQAHPEVYADAGFALLSAGQEAAGHALLKEARAAYLSRGDTPALRQLLSNELLYAQTVGDTYLAQETQRALREVEQSVSPGLGRY
jgi:hypothetical protein